MNSRESVLAALNHEEPDRVPIDLGGNQTGIHKNAYRDLLDQLGMDDDTEIMDPVQQLAEPSEEVLERFEVDTRYVAPGPPDDWDGGVEENERDGRRWYDLVDEFGVRWSMPADNPLYMDISDSPLAEADVQAVKDYPFPDGSDPTRFEGVAEDARRVKEDGPYAVATATGGVIYETCWYLRGLEQWYCDMVMNQEFCAELMDRLLGFWLDWYEGFLDEAGDELDIIMMGDDLAGQDGPLFRPSLYREMVKPRHKRLVQFVRERTDAAIWYHTCGACQEFIPDLVDNGVDVLNPVQVGAKDMDPHELKDEFGDRIVFWGGAIDAQHVLPSASPQKVREHVRHNVEAFKPGGGFVFNNVHNIQGRVPPENIVALFEAGLEYGSYGE